MDSFMKLFTEVGKTAPGQLISVAVSLLAALISLAAAGTVTWFARINYRREMTNQRLNFMGVQQKYFEDIKRWADELSDLISEARHLCELEPSKVVGESFFDRRHRLKLKLSSLIDRGRWFFPNVRSEEDNQGNYKGFVGYRHAILDSLVATYGQIIAIDYAHKSPNEKVKDQLVNLKKSFVIEVQRVLDPARRQREYKALMRSIGGDND
jgi:hypothetical protein